MPHEQLTASRTPADQLMRTAHLSHKIDQLGQVHAEIQDGLNDLNDRISTLEDAVSDLRAQVRSLQNNRVAR